MLHTDAFNKHNRGKMSRADYVKNTRLDGVPNEVLEVTMLLYRFKNFKGLSNHELDH